VKDMLSNINKNPNSITWKTCSTTLSRIQTPKHERHHAKKAKSDASAKFVNTQMQR
jgi:hypothetical protein